jgi:glycosyltransferase involved in cell wall biosynthesis
LDKKYLKISIITPNYNAGKYLEATIKSIISQNYPNLEYIIIDGGSTDNSIDIIKKHEKHINYWTSEPDNGLYDALSKGLSISTGEIMGWLNSDDILHPESLFTINEVFQLKNVKWIEGIPTTIDEFGRTISVSGFSKWSKFKFWNESYEWIQQESTYWHRDLWDKAGGYINKNLKLAGDMELWNRFFYHENLYSIRSLIGGFRIRSENQLSLESLNEYHNEAKSILSNNIYDNNTLKVLKRINRLKVLMNLIVKTKIFNHSSIIFRINRNIYSLMDFPEDILFDRKTQKFKIAN